ncbi:aspartate:alanine antiporter [Kitasatospora sp. MMS16-BH015]|uniref:aspartate-alanine antiporter n=1 Tax=Kitasatospora sp. MMS16-BH015 TaxID=2018025 RepID=UPI000CA10119|nr:aspartate-alanine antiporter [Kitasatospora sp. MMS16-BH015]AUG80946.1 aspartate:alanine antiporter [Kitasatospora sp. MMS16-BH015]
MSLLRENAVLALFACLALGYLIGKLRVGPIQLGGICGTLIVSMLIGAQHVSVNSDVKNVAFALFIFSLGYIAGPQFFANLNAKGLRFGVLSVMEAGVVIGLALGFAKGFDLDVGTASGILAGAATESAVVGTAQEAITKLAGITPDQSTQLQAHVATAYSVCYLFGLVTIVMLTSQIMPLMMRINLADASRTIWERMRGADASLAADEQASLPALVGRTYLVSQGEGSSVKQLEADSGLLVAVEGVKRGEQVLTVGPELRLRRGDRVLVVGARDAVRDTGHELGPETSGEPGLDSPLAVREVVVTNKAVSGKTVAALRAGEPESVNGVFLTDIQRVDHHLPAVGETELHQGDTLTVVGARSKVEKFAAKVGASVRQDSADYIYISLGICLGVLLGMVTVHAGSVNLALGTGGGCLIAGLVFGWLRAQRPTFGAYPPVAAQTAKDLGLSMFIAVTGMAAGPDAGPLLKQYPVLLPSAGILMVVVPAMLSLVVGRKLLKIEPPILIGAIAGQQCSTPAITAIGNVAQSSVPMLGYTITYTISNFLLPLTGPVLVGILGLS